MSSFPSFFEIDLENEKSASKHTCLLLSCFNAFRLWIASIHFHGFLSLTSKTDISPHMSLSAPPPVRNTLDFEPCAPFHLLVNSSRHNTPTAHVSLCPAEYKVSIFTTLISSCTLSCDCLHPDPKNRHSESDVCSLRVRPKPRNLK